MKILTIIVNILLIITTASFSLHIANRYHITASVYLYIYFTGVCTFYAILNFIGIYLKNKQLKLIDKLELDYQQRRQEIIDLVSDFLGEDDLELLKKKIDGDDK